jgi:hypothetical protein
MPHHHHHHHHHHHSASTSSSSSHHHHHHHSHSHPTATATTAADPDLIDVHEIRRRQAENATHGLHSYIFSALLCVTAAGLSLWSTPFTPWIQTTIVSTFTPPNPGIDGLVTLTRTFDSGPFQACLESTAVHTAPNGDVVKSTFSSECSRYDECSLDAAVTLQGSVLNGGYCDRLKTWQALAGIMTAFMCAAAIASLRALDKHYGWCAHRAGADSEVMARMEKFVKGAVAMAALATIILFVMYAFIVNAEKDDADDALADQETNYSMPGFESLGQGTLRTTLSDVSIGDLVIVASMSFVAGLIGVKIHPPTRMHYHTDTAAQADADAESESEKDQHAIELNDVHTHGSSSGHAKRKHHHHSNNNKHRHHHHHHQHHHHDDSQ